MPEYQISSSRIHTKAEKDCLRPHGITYINSTLYCIHKNEKKSSKKVFYFVRKFMEKSEKSMPQQYIIRVGHLSRIKSYLKIMKQKKKLNNTITSSCHITFC